MLKKYLIILIIIMFTATEIKAADFYPEMGMDPFYSSLNPFNIVQEDKPSDTDSVFDYFKKFKQKKSKQDKNQSKDITVQKQNIKPEDSVKNEVTEVSEVEKVDNENEVNEVTEITEINEEKDENDINEENGLAILKQNKTSDNDDNIKEVNDETFVSPAPKKHLTKIELERELRKEERERQREEEARLNAQKGNNFSLKDKIFFFKKKKNNQTTPQKQSEPKIELSADYMEYFPERYEVEAIGNAKVNFIQQNTTLEANKIVYNYDMNILTASEDVVLKSSDAVTEGDFIRLDLKKPEGWIENPVSTTDDIILNAKEAYIYSDKIEEYDGVAKILKDEVMSIGARSFASYVDQSGYMTAGKTKDYSGTKGIYKLKADTIVIDSEDDHEVITVKNADVYLKNHRIGAIPSLKIVTNKQRTNAESNIPEFGSQNMLGMHVGPAVVLNVPGGSTLKLAPILTYKNDEFGLGAIARYRSEHNMTELAYGSSVDEILLRGKHKIAKGLTLQYSRFTNQNEWFLGYRMPKYSAHLDYARSDYVKDLKLNFSQLYSAGVFVDRYAPRDHTKDAEGRFRWMTQTFKPIYSYDNEEGNVNVNLGLIAQTSASVYTSGERVGLFRVGPALSTMVGPWRQSVIYYQTASDGRSPFGFDRYRYGRSNLVFLESLRVCKYLTLGYLASLAMDNDYKDDKLFQESRILVSIGPEYVKLTIGYDAYRRNTMFQIAMMVGTKDSDIEFKKSVLNNPNKFGKEKSKQKKTKKKSYKKYLKQDIMPNG